MKSPLSKILDELREQVELEGHEPGSPRFERVFLARRVAKCQELRGVGECRDCNYFMDCELAKQYMMSVKYGGKDDDSSKS